MRVAAVDVGSNSFHMVVAQVEADGRFQVVDRAKEMVRLGRRTLTRGRLSAQAMNDGVQVLGNFKTLAERLGVARFSVVATSAVREAQNGGDFVQRVKREVGLRVRVIPGREEARLVGVAVLHALDLRDGPALIVDAGGGSVELVLVDQGQAVAFDSVKLGVSRLSEKFLDSERPNARDIQSMVRHIEEELDPVFERFRVTKIRRVVATSGTLLNLVALAGAGTDGAPPAQLHNLSVSPGEISRLRRQLVRCDRAERQSLRGVDPKRADFIVVGACLADQVLRRVNARELVACAWALREGLLLDFISRHRQGIEETEQFEDPRRRSVARFVRHLGHAGPHPRHTAYLALGLFDQLAEDLAAVSQGREWLEYAALMHDIGHHIGHKDHQLHSYYLIRNGELLGFRPEEVQALALIARHHRKAPARDSDDEMAALPKAVRRSVQSLSAILRVADALDRSHYGVVKKVEALRGSGRLTLRVWTAGEDAALEVWEARRRCGPLGELLGCSIDFQVATGRDREDD